MIIGESKSALRGYIGIMYRNRLLFLVLGGTWFRTADPLRHPTILIDHCHRNESSQRARDSWAYGPMKPSTNGML